MSDEDLKIGRRSTDATLGALAERLDNNSDMLDRIFTQTEKTNGRVSELEIKERIRQDREEQAAIRSAAAEAAKFRVEQHNEQQAVVAQERAALRITWKMMILAAGVGATPAVLVEIAHLLSTGHL